MSGSTATKTAKGKLMRERSAFVRFFYALFRYKALYIFLIPAAITSIIFAYIPLAGVIVAFKDFDVWLGFFGSPWADPWYANFLEIFQVKALFDSILNTIWLSMLNLLIGFPAPIIFALLLNELHKGIFKKSVQTISYMPHFLSWISVIGITHAFLGEYGPVNDFFAWLFPNHTRTLYLAQQDLFVPIQVGLGIWKSVGFSAIIYLAAITGVDPQLHEAAAIDGAGHFKRILHITLPGIAPTIAILFILSIGGILASNFELVFGLQNPFIDFETIDTVVYKFGLLQPRFFSRTTALGLIRGLIALGLTVGANQITKKLSGTSVF